MSAKRDTKQRRMVLQEIRCRCDHPSADDIYQAIRMKDSRVSRGTVYRNLNLLSESGEIHRVELSYADRFDRTTAPHDHLLCTVCGRVIDAPTVYDVSNDTAIAEQTGYSLIRHETIFKGVCPECQKNAEAKQNETDL